MRDYLYSRKGEGGLEALRTLNWQEAEGLDVDHG